jgi:phosphate transport system protein
MSTLSNHHYFHPRDGLLPTTILLYMSRLFRSSSPAEESSTPLVRVSQDLRPKTVRVFALVGEAIAGATHALLANDRELAKRIVEQDIIIDDLVNELVSTAEDRLLESAALDVEGRRELLILLRILPEVERNGDLAEHVARRAARGLGAEMSPRSRGLIERMGEVASTIWREATDVIIDGRAEAWGAIEDIDDELDDLHVSLTAELTSGSMSVPVAVEVALMARFYERFGDHCVNLARRQVGRDGAD